MTIRRVFTTLIAVFVAWIVVMAAVMRFSEAAPAAVVPWPTKDFLKSLPPNAAILDVNGMAVTFANRPDLAAELYAAGAWLVLPAGLVGCLPLSKRQKEALLRR